MLTKTYLLINHIISWQVFFEVSRRSSHGMKSPSAPAFVNFYTNSPYQCTTETQKGSTFAPKFDFANSALQNYLFMHPKSPFIDRFIPHLSTI